MTTAVEEPSLGRRERKKAETRRRIRQAALDLALRRGVEHVTTEEISEAADISPRTFFNYFDCKEDALVADSTDRAEELRQAIASRPPEESPLAVLQYALAHSFIVKAAPPERAEVQARYRLVRDSPQLLPRHLKQFAALEKAIEEGMRERLGSEDSGDLRPALLAAVGVSVLRLATQRWASADTADWTGTVEASFRILEQRFA